MAYISFQPKDYFNTKLYTGTGSSNAQTGVGFQPDWVWIKNRDAAEAHSLYDAVRGTQKVIYSNLTNGQATETNGLSSFDSDGFTVGSSGAINGSSQNIVSWNWKANGQGSSNTDGSINTTYTSANTTSGFSISTYTGTGANATVGHGLGVVPSVVIVKRYSFQGDWIGYFKALGNTKNARFNTTDAADTNSTVWNSTTPTSSVFSVGTFGETNASGYTYVAYCFAPIKGFSAMGSYTGNQNANGTFTFTGFKPAFVMIKNATQSGDRWIIHDDKRDPDNGCNHRLFPDGNIVESTSTTSLDFLSNGFKQRTDAGTSNTNGQTYIYMAFAEAPLVSSNGVPATAR